MEENIAKNKIIISDCNTELRKEIINAFKHDKMFEVVGESGEGFETLEIVKKQNPDVLIMDVVLPGLDGFALIETIMKSNEIMKKPKIVVTSSLAHEGFINKAMQLGVSYFMIKPINGLGGADVKKVLSSSIKDIRQSKRNL